MLVIRWSRELMKLQIQHTVPTLILQVDGYSILKKRDEIIIPGKPGTLYNPDIIERISVDIQDI